MNSSSNPTSWKSDAHMTTQQNTRDAVLSVLTTIAPEVDADDIRDDVLLRDQVDLDSMDWLNFLLGIHKRMHVDIPESDYASLRTLTDVVNYVDKHAAKTA
ncbi:Acyl carrier protein [Mycobacterium innocens]|nr:Acyl carrier protein [Mycobacterium innocens]